MVTYAADLMRSRPVNAQSFSLKLSKELLLLVNAVGIVSLDSYKALRNIISTVSQLRVYVIHGC